MPAPGANPLSRLAGLPDDAFEHDGQLTKREVRAMTLARLAPLAGEMLWDLGAGCGSIAIEWLRAIPGGSAIAVEHSEVRVAMIARNAARLGVPGLRIVVGRAPGRSPVCRRRTPFLSAAALAIPVCWAQRGRRCGPVGGSSRMSSASRANGSFSIGRRGMAAS